MQEFWKKLTGHFLPGHENAYRPHLLRKSWLLFFLTIVLTAEGLYIATLATEESARNFLSAVLPGDVIALTNAQRAGVGDNSLTENDKLTLAAQHKAEDMAAKSYFSHVGPDGKEPWSWISEAGYTYAQAGENLAVRFDDSVDVVNAWMASPTHRANIVKPGYTEIGIGVAQGTYQGAPATFIVQYFGTPQRVAVAPQPTATSEVAEAAAPAALPAVAGAETEAKTEVTQKAVTPIATATQSDSVRPVPAFESQQQAQSSMREAAQAFLRASDASRGSTAAIIGGIALLLVVLVGLAIFVHIEIQPTEMLLGGAFVAAVAISLFVLNSSVVSVSTGNEQSASVVNATTPPTILIGSEGASTEAGG